VEDILYRNKKLNCCNDLDYTDEILNEALIILEDMCFIITGKKTSPFRTENISKDSEIIRETSYDIEKLNIYVNT